jgi:hypothetical protein
MFSRKITYFVAICFVLYSLLQHNYRTTGAIVPKIRLSEISKLPHDAADNSFMLKVLKKLSYKANDNFACDVVKQEIELYRVFISDASSKNLTCKDSFEFDYKIYQINGKLLYQSTEAKKYLLEKYEIPYAMQKALIYAQYGSNLTIISPAKYLIKNAKMESLPDFFATPLFKSLDEVILIDLQIH